MTTENHLAALGTLIQDRMGWPIPVDALQWWVRGLAAPGEIDGRELDGEGRLMQLDQLGWRVVFKRYRTDPDQDAVSMPVRLEAGRENYRVKLAISGWRLGRDEGG